MNPSPSARACRPRLARLLATGLTAATCLLAGTAPADDRPAAPARGPVLTLVDGEALPGALAESGRAGTIAWKVGTFEAPFHFPLGEVASVRFPVAGKPPAAAGAFGFDLGAGGVVFGTLAALGPDAFEVSVPRFGRLKVDRDRVRQVFRWGDGRDLIYDGPNGPAGWREFSAFKSIADAKPAPNRPQQGQGQGQVFIQGQVRAQFDQGPGMFGMVNPIGAAQPVPPAEPVGPLWVEDGGQLGTTRGGASLQADVGLPARSSVEFELAWNAAPNFVLALGVGDDEKSVARAFRFEVWEGQLVALRETDQEATLTPILPIPAGAGRVHLRVDLDQEAGKLVVRSADGDRLAELALGGAGLPALPGIRLTNIQGDLRLERLRVFRATGDSPAGPGRPPGPGDAVIARRGQPAVRGRLAGFDATSREFVVEGSDGPARVAEADVEIVTLPRADREAPEAVRVVYADGTELAGKWVGLAGQQLTLTVAGVAGIVALPLQGVRSLDFPRQDRKPRDRDDSLGTLELDGLKLVGRLAGAGGASGLAWQPLASETASPIRAGASGRIVYKEGAAPAGMRLANDARARLQEQQRLEQIKRLNAANGVATRRGAAPEPATRRSLYLRSGDIVPVEVTKIDEEGVTFKSPILAGQFVPHARIKALEVASPDPTALRLSSTKLERLLTLPRMQKENPPTHLIRSKNGDMLRARVLGMDDKALRIEVRLDEKEVPRDRVSLLIWLHPDETDPTKKAAAPAPAEPPPGPLRVQAVRTDGIRLTFLADGFADGAVVGKSDVLGPCRVQTKDLEELLIGGLVEQEAVQLAYQNFRLHRATEPKSAGDEDDPGAGGAEGTEAALVGKAAPDFNLDLLDGAKFHLADKKGTILVLDFWATWCGPCLQAMPQIERVTAEFADRNVQLVAVNLQETPTKIRALLERQKLHPAVALDRDGAVARLYGANAIPQTVVIDQEGKITRLFVGGGPKLGDQLRDALQALMPVAQP